MCLFSEAQQEFRCYCENGGMNTDYVGMEFTRDELTLAVCLQSV